MSHGIGKMQQDILNTLDQAKQDMVYYRGSARSENAGRVFDTWIWDKPGWVKVGRNKVRIAEHVYDLWASNRFIAKLRGETYSHFTKPDFQASFSRAVKSLIKRGLISACNPAPLAEVDPAIAWRIDEWSRRCFEGEYWFNITQVEGVYCVATKQRRFIVKC